MAGVLETALSIPFSWIAMIMKEKCSVNTIINLVIWVFTFTLGGQFHYYHVLKQNPVNNIVTVFIPPLGYYLSTKRCDLHFIICLLIYLFSWTGIGYFVSAFWARHFGTNK